jgi:hypothetical protein
MLAFVFFAGYLFAASGQKIVSAEHLNGNVRRIYAYTYLAKDIVIQKNVLVSYEKEKIVSHIEYIYEKNGLLLAENRFNSEDILDRSLIYTYENDKLVDYTRAISGKYQLDRTVYQYDKTGKKTQAVSYDGKDSLENTVVYKYDSLGNLITEKKYNSIYMLITDLQYQYDDKGNCILVNNIKTNRKSSKAYQEIQRFDDRNNRIYKSYIVEDSLNWEYIVRYNENDSLIYEELKDGKGITTFSSELKYDKLNRRTSLKQYKQDASVPEMLTRYKYDKKGRLDTEIVYVSNNKKPVMTRTYFYDEMENWIYRLEKEETSDKGMIHYRKIVYY